MVHPQTKGMAVNAEAQSQKLWIEDGRQKMIATPFPLEHRLNGIELDMAVGTSHTEVRRP